MLWTGANPRTSSDLRTPSKAQLHGSCWDDVFCAPCPLQRKTQATQAGRSPWRRRLPVLFCTPFRCHRRPPLRPPLEVWKPLGSSCPCPGCQTSPPCQPATVRGCPNNPSTNIHAGLDLFFLFTLNGLISTLIIFFILNIVLANLFVVLVLPEISCVTFNPDCTCRHERKLCSIRSSKLAG